MSRHMTEVEIEAWTEFKNNVLRVYDWGVLRNTGRYLWLLLESRGFEQSMEHFESVFLCRDQSQMDRWFERALTATSAEEVFAAGWSATAPPDRSRRLDCPYRPIVCTARLFAPPVGGQQSGAR